MLTVNDYGRIRRAHRDGMSIREIARRFHHSRRKVRKVLRGAGQPWKYPRRQTQSAPRLGPFHERILQILSDDELQPPKQRHTAMRIFERLRDEQSYADGYDAVRCWLLRHGLANPANVMQMLSELRQADQQTKGRKAPETSE